MPLSTEVKHSESAHSAPSSSAKPAPPTNLNRAETEAIGPSTDTPAAAPDNSNGPVLVIMLLLTTGARHPYKIDEKYLKKRNVTIEAMDPYNISVYTLKELIWRDWREGMSKSIFRHNHVDQEPEEQCIYHATCKEFEQIGSAVILLGVATKHIGRQDSSLPFSPSTAMLCPTQPQHVIPCAGRLT